MVPHTCGILFHCLLQAFDKNLRRLECNECKIGKKEHDRSDDDSDPMSQGDDASSVVQNKIGRKQRYLLSSHDRPRGMRSWSNMKQEKRVLMNSS
jgi:hypothetical protein